MKVFLERFGQPGPVTKENPFGYHFTNVRSGLIVALVSRYKTMSDLINLSSYQLVRSAAA